MGNKLLKMDCLSYSRNLDDEYHHSSYVQKLKPAASPTPTSISMTPSDSYNNNKEMVNNETTMTRTEKGTVTRTNRYDQQQQLQNSKYLQDSNESNCDKYDPSTMPSIKIPKSYTNSNSFNSDRNPSKSPSNQPYSCQTCCKCACKPQSQSMCYKRRCIKVLFLDVDGVLNTKNTKWSVRTKGIEDRLLRYLKIILDKTKCKIVLSTAWRLHYDYRNILLHELQTRADININDVIIGQTPSMPNCKRSTEISTFIHRYNKDINNRYYITNFAVIDDLPLHKYPNSLFLNGHFVRTDKFVGISIINVMNCIQILNHNFYRNVQRTQKQQNKHTQQSQKHVPSTATTEQYSSSSSTYYYHSIVN